MDFKMYVQNVVATYVEKTDRNVIFIKHYNTLDISKEEILACVKNTNDEVFLYHEYSISEMHEAYAPFLEWIRQCYNMYYKNRMTVEAFLKECGVYSVHIEPLSGFIKNNVCIRKEDILHFEILYETESMLKNIVNILEYISRHQHLIMILSKFHLAPYGTIRLLRYIMDRTMNVHIVIMYNDEFPIADYKKRVWDELMQQADEHNLQLDWGSMDSEKTIDVLDEFWFDTSKTDDYFIKLTNMYQTFALEDAYYYMTNILYRIDEKTIWITEVEEVSFILLAAMIEMNLNHVNHALVLCDKITDVCTNLVSNYLIKFHYYYICTRARMILSQTKYVEEGCSKCISIAKENKDDYLVCKAEIILWLSYCGICRDIFEYYFCNKVDMSILEKAQKYGLNNFLAYINVFGFENDADSIRDIAMGKKEPTRFNLGIKQGTELGNDNFLMNAYMKNIILYSRAGYHEYVRKMYEKRLKVLKRPNPFREAHMFAGLGYNSIILEDFEKAHEYLIQSVYTLTELEKPDDVMNSLYNLALDYFVSESYHNVIKVVEMILKMMKELGFNNIRACSTTKLYSMIAISCYYQGEFYNSYYYLSKMEVIVEHLLSVLRENEDKAWDEDFCLYHLTKGMLYNHENQYFLCQKEFDDVIKYMEAATGTMFFTMPILSVEKAVLYRNMGQPEKADEVFDEVIKFCDKEKLFRKKEKIKFFKENGVRDKEPILKLSADLPVVDMLRISRQFGTQNKLNKREDDIKFLTVLQEAISRENLMTSDLFQNTSAVLKNSYNLDDILIIRRKDGRRTVMHEGDANFISNKKIDEIFEFFKSYKQAFIANRTDKNFVKFLPAMKPFNEKNIMTLIGIPIMEHSGTETVFLAYIKIKPRSIASRMLMGRADLMILKFAFSQFCEMMRRIDNRMMIERMNQKLEQSAITDHLTGITNRNGFSRQAEVLFSQDSSRINVILYLDLDNFKYYNDTFGHEIGDLVLVCFAEMFKKMTRDNGLVVRYGGDEFIILLYDQTEKDGAILAQQIYYEIRGGFRDEIAQKLGKPIEIPEQKKISCSIGISSFHGGSKEAMDIALNQADQMLYYVKRNGKSKYKLFHETDL